MRSSFHESVGLRFDGATSKFEPVPIQELSWSITDLGTLYGTILVERFRTYGTKLLNLSDNQSRLAFGASQLGIDMSTILDIKKIAQQLLDLNSELVSNSGDVSLVFLLAPGEQSSNKALGHHPTCMMHLSPLPFMKLNHWYTHGTDLRLSSHCSVPESCWPTQMKSRSRLHYYLADAKAASVQSDSLAVLTTPRGTISDTSVANLLMVDSSGTIVSPAKSDILVGCTLQAVERILKSQNTSIQFRDIEFDELSRASEIILTGSSGGVWFASSVDGMSIGKNGFRPKLRMLTDLWKAHVGVDYIAQANRLMPTVG